jgi:hypothetical protein
MAKTEDVAQFLKGTPSAEKFIFSRTFTATQAKFQNKKIQIVHYPPHKLSSASSVELIS